MECHRPVTRKGNKESLAFYHSYYITVWPGNGLFYQKGAIKDTVVRYLFLVAPVYIKGSKSFNQNSNRIGSRKLITPKKPSTVTDSKSRPVDRSQYKVGELWITET